LLLEIQAAAREGDTSAVLNSARKLETLENLITLAKKPSTPLTPCPPRPPATDGLSKENGAALSPKARGHHHRDNFVRMLQSRGVALQQVKGPIFRTAAGTRVGIAYAHEGNARNKDRWFLGLPENQFDHAMLLCEPEHGELMFFSLPTEFMGQHGSGLSCRDGQVKFSVFRRSGECFLLVPRQGRVNIEPYRDNLNHLS
jgi:hypothetical protein